MKIHRKFQIHREIKTSPAKTSPLCLVSAVSLFALTTITRLANCWDMSALTGIRFHTYNTPNVEMYKIKC